MGERLAIRAQRFFDGVLMLARGMIVVEDGRIASVDRNGAPPPDGARVVDLGHNATLLPGLIDCHVHLALDATPQAVTNVTTADQDMLLLQMEQRAVSAQVGVTTMRDLGDRGYLAVALARKAASPDGPLLPEIVAAGPPITTPGGHFAMLGGEVAGADALRAAVQERAERGCQWVKVMASGGNLSPQTRPWESQFSLEDLRIVADEAHCLGLRTAAHAHATSAIADATDAGFDTLEHATFFTVNDVEFDPAIAERILAQGTFISATAGMLPGGQPPPAIAARMPKIIANMLALHRSGVRIVPGPDGGIGPAKPHHVLPYALEQVATAGLGGAAALRAATSEAAEACGVAGRKGRIAPGADADLLIVNGDPTADAMAIHDVAGVLRGGRFAVPLTSVASPG